MNVIYAIPGLGTTGELFQNIAVAGYELKVLNWPLPQKQFTLKDYAAGFLKQIDTSQPVNLLGVSFGGMLCAELAQQIKTDKVVLISSCKNRLQFPKLLKFLKAVPVYRLISDQALRRMAKHSRHILGFDKPLTGLFLNMVNAMPENYFSYCIPYIVKWDLEKENNNIIQIHGTADRLLTPTRIKNAYSIKNGSHAMVLNKAAEINTILNKTFNGL